MTPTEKKYIEKLNILIGRQNLLINHLNYKPDNPTISYIDNGIRIKLQIKGLKSELSVLKAEMEKDKPVLSAEEWMKENYFDEENGTWMKFDDYETMEEYADYKNNQFK